MKTTPIGIFDSGYGGLTILSAIRRLMPQYDYLYLGDNARAPYGPRSFEVVYEYTRQAVETLFRQGCRLVILACNTASAKALRTIQQNDLGMRVATHRVLGVIRPTVEAIGSLTESGHIGLFATPGTVKSGSYHLELQKLVPQLQLTSLACPMWVPLVEYGEAESDGANFFVEKRVNEMLHADPKIDTFILGCTHYPLLLSKIRKATPGHIRIVAQGDIVAYSLQNYLHRHGDLEAACTKGGNCRYLTTENAETFASTARIFLNQEVTDVEKITLGVMTAHQ